MSELTIFDVAAWFLRETGGPVVTLKLHKLCFYAQAWSLVWDDRPLFDEEFTVWANGPMSNDLFAVDKAKYWVRLEEFEAVGADPDKVQGEALQTCEAVQEYYAKFSATQLSALSRVEDPWKDARRGVAEDEWGEPLIPLAEIKRYYGGLIDHPEDSEPVATLEFPAWVL